MDVMELMQGRRTYRRFLQKPVPQDVIDDIIEAVRLSSAGANRQATSLLIIRRPEQVAQVNALVKWAAFLPPEQGTPKADEQPVLYAAVLQDTSVPGDLNTDTGIALANMTLAAWAKGVGSCIMGAINRPKLSEMFALPEHIHLHTMVAFGYPCHKSYVVPMQGGDNKYYLDADRNYCVPKRSKEEIARYL
jgi:FMN reductase [NAD(P)H]